MTSNQSDKRSLRQHLLTQRRTLDEAAWQTKSDALCQQLIGSGILAPAKTVLAYFSTQREPDLSPLFRDTNRQWGFPRCQDKTLLWHTWSLDSPLPREVNRYGILEPHPEAPRLAPESVDLLLVPAVACDRQGYRLGYGGGFYDRLLAQPEWATVPTVGIIFAEALLPAVPTMAWDRPLQMVCTDRSFYRVKKAPLA